MSNVFVSSSGISAVPAASIGAFSGVAIGASIGFIVGVYLAKLTGSSPLGVILMGSGGALIGGAVAYVLIFANLQTLKQKKKTQYDLAKEIKYFDFVERVDIVSGGSDLVAMIRVKDVSEFDKVLLGKLQLVEGIDKTQSLIVIHEE